MFSMHRIVSLVVFLSLISLTMPVSSQEQSAAKINASGMTAFSEGRYADAAELFGRAYSLEPRPELLKNRAVASYRAGDCIGAVDSAHQFLKEAPKETADHQEARSLIGACKVKMASEAVEAGDLQLAETLLGEAGKVDGDDGLSNRISAVRLAIAKKRSASPDQPSEESAETTRAADQDSADAQAQPDVDQKAGSADPSTGPSDPPYTPTAPADHSNDLAGWSLLSTGAAILVGGAIYHTVMATAVEPELRRVGRAGDDRARYETLDGQLRTANWLVPSLYAAGAAAGATGAWLLITPSPQGNDQPAVTLGFKASF